MTASSEPETPYERQQRRLRHFHDVLASTPMAERYWFSGGALLGWAREGRLLTHDALDVDFHYLAEDTERLEASFPLLVEAGYRVGRRFPNICPKVSATQWALTQDDAVFDFFRVEDMGDHFRTYSYGWRDGVPTENLLALPRQHLEEFFFLGRHWLKPADHEAELTALYGDWRTPDPHFDYMEGRAIVSRRPWDVGPGFEFPAP